MSKFSDRIGVTEPKSLMQLDSMDLEMRTRIWNFLYELFLEDLPNLVSHSEHEEIIKRFWITHLNNKKDELFKYRIDLNAYLKLKIFEEWKWYEVYNFLEFLLQNFYERRKDNIENMEICNKIFEDEMSGYRFINYELCPISSREEMDSINETLDLNSEYKLVKKHISQSIALLSNKINPDYRNSIKESISAVECMVKKIAGSNTATLGQALKVIEDKHTLHPALKKSFSNLYGYTSEADGIRHSLLEDENLKQEDAVYLLVSCSAFINYLKVKSIP